MNTIWTDRSRIEQYQRCHRSRYLGYHCEGQGVTSTYKPLPLAVGGSVHVGLSVLLIGASKIPTLDDPMAMACLEQDAVNAALADFKQFQGRVALDLSEQTAIDKSDIKSLEAQLLGSVPTSPDQSPDQQVVELGKIREKSLSEFDRYLWEEQSSLVEAMVRAYARRKLRPLLEQYEVLEVEREGQWKLSEWHTGTYSQAFGDKYMKQYELWFMSRPDALLLERESRQLYLQSFKTAASWDIRKAKDAERDMQGLSEGVEVEKRLAEWWIQVNNSGSFKDALGFNIPTNVYSYLKSCKAPPRIMGIRYEYLLKGDRILDKDLTQDLGIELRSQRSPLIRGYYNPGMVRGDEQWNWSYKFIKEDGQTSQLYWKSWRGSPVWRWMPIKDWIDRLDQTAQTVGEEGRHMGWSGPAQASGFTENHPFDEVFMAPIVVYRNDDDLRDWFEQTEAQEREVAQHVEEVAQAKEEAEKRHLLNIHFQQTRRACEYPTTCQFVHICFGGSDIRRDPLGSGKYQLRVPHHQPELEAKAEAKDAK